MSRRYPTAEVYEDRRRDFYRNGNRGSQSYEDLHSDFPHPGEVRRGQPEFLREDYGRTSAGPLVLSGRRQEPAYEPRKARSVRGGYEERDDFSVRDRRDSTRRNDFERDEVIIRKDERDPRSRSRAMPGGFEDDETEIRISRRETEGPKPRRDIRDNERDDITSRRSSVPRLHRDSRTTEIDIEREEYERSRGRGHRDYEKDDIQFRRVEGNRFNRGGDYEKDELIVRRDSRESRPRGAEIEKDTLVVRTRDRSLPPPRLVAREREDFVVRRRDPSPPSPPRRGREEHEEIIIRRTARSPSSSPERSPSPPPPPPQLEPIVRPPIVQEIITHHRHIDHGVERARSPTPPPAPLPLPSPPKEESLEIEIRRRNTSRGRATFDENVIIDAGTRERRDQESTELQIRRRRSMSMPRRKSWRDEEIEIDDVRSTAGRTRSDMWTEVTKDLVIREAVDKCGYRYEESEGFFYVKEYLRYEDVLQLVEISDDLRNSRRSRYRDIDIDIKREEYESRERRPRNYDERVYERDVLYDSRGGRRYR